MAAIVFLDATTPFSGASLREGSLGGIQSGTVFLAEAMARAGHSVRVLNMIEAPVTVENVSYEPFEGAVRAGVTADAAISNNRASLLAKVKARTRIIWFRNPTKFSRLLKKGDLAAVLSLRPHAVLLGAYHASKTPGWIPFASRVVIPHGVDPLFRRSEPSQEAPGPRAIFVSQPYRGLDWVMEVWRDRIKPHAPEGAELHVFTPKVHQIPGGRDELKHDGIIVRGSLSKSDLARELQEARVMLYPGHRDETFCNAAAEATAAGLPVVTRGFGSLSDRIEHGHTGFIAEDAEAFARNALEVLSDEARWLELHRACLSDPGVKSWDVRVKEWERLISSRSRTSSL